MDWKKVFAAPVRLWFWLCRDIGGFVLTLGCVLWAGVIGHMDADGLWLIGPVLLLSMSRSEAVMNAEKAGFLRATEAFLKCGAANGEILFTINDNRPEAPKEPTP